MRRVGRLTAGPAVAVGAVVGTLSFGVPAAAAAPVADDVSAATSNGDPVAVTLHGSDDFDSTLTVSVVDGPSNGTLGPIGSLDCTYPGGQTNCTAEVTYTPGPCLNGSDSFSYRVADGLASDDGMATIAVSSLVPSFAKDRFVASGSVYETTAADLLPGATVDYGDGGGSQEVTVEPDGTAVLSHLYPDEGSYRVTVRNPGGCEAAGYAHVLLPGATSTGVVDVGPGEIGTLDLGLLSATLTTASTDPSAATLLAALYPPGTPGFDPRDLTALSAFDLRTIGATSADVLVAKFRYPADTPPGTVPTLLFLDPQSGRFEPVGGSTKLPDSLVVDEANREITIVFDDTSFPTLTSLKGTPLVVAHDRRPRVRVRGVVSRCAFGVRVNDDGKLRRVIVKLDGEAIKATGQDHFRVRLAVDALGEGRHRLRVVAVDRSGGRGSDAKRFHRFGRRCFSG
ncbi:MAG TPA: Ig-like domain-containing protein [Solirubrobacterales bacterium]|nr:Ig-like domain-containing protein [Solirubrobacterales bacterium]